MADVSHRHSSQHSNKKLYHARANAAVHYLLEEEKNHAREYLITYSIRNL